MLWSDIGAWLLGVFDSYGYPLTFVGALLENTSLGILFPGGTVVLLAAAYTRLGSLLWPAVWLLGWMGMLSGSSIDYWLGRKALRPFMERLPLHAQADKHLARARSFLERFGAAAIFLSHVMGHMRGFVALSAGSSHLPYHRYLMFEAPAALLWSLFYSALGYYLAGNLDLAEKVIARIGATAFSLVVVVGLVALLVTRGPASGFLARLRRSGQNAQGRDEGLAQP